jgi:16S rRNA processing protein RimM
MAKDVLFDGEKYLECGRIINTHGIKGEVKIDSWCDSPEILAELDRVYFKENAAFVEKRVIRAYVHKRFVIAAIEGISDIDTAESMKDTVIYASRDDVPLDEGDYFIADLIGLPVIDADSGKLYGKISEVFNNGATDIYTVNTESGERMIPAVDEFIVSVDFDEGVLVRPIEGMFD